MQIRNLGILLLSIGLFAWSRSLPAAPPVADHDDALRERVLAAIDLGQRAIIGMQSRDGSWSTTRWTENSIGVSGLATLALLSTGLTPEHPAVAKGLTWLKRSDPNRTYDIAMTIMCLTAANDRTAQGKVQRLASLLEQQQHRGPEGGNWGYAGEEGWWDNSNTQFAILGLREAAAAGASVDREVWRRAQDHFLRLQAGPVNSPVGSGWNYNSVQPTVTGSMTVAGIASLSITSAMLMDDSDVSPDGTIDCCGDHSQEADDAVESGVLWLTRHFRTRTNPGSANWPLYYLYGLERVGRFTGRRFFGEHDWYREGAEFLVEGQSPREGVWHSNGEEDVVGTSLALLFLSKGLSPVVINKLKFGPRDGEGEVIGRDWNRHTRDISNLVEFTAGLERWPHLLSWQVVDLRTAAMGEGVAALLQSPIQFISGTERPESIQGRELELLRNYLAQGGFIFAVQNCSRADFDEGFRDLVRRLFDGQYDLQRLPPTHDVYRSEYVFSADAAPPELWGVDFGCRTAIIYAPFDHACRWNKWSRHEPPGRPLALKTQIEKSMMLGVNVIAYATGRELQDKLQRPKALSPDVVRQSARGRLTIARLRHTGGWDTAPNALRRLQAALEAVNVEAASETPNLAATDPALFDYPLLYMHGRKNFQFSEEERNKLRQYIANGGFLFADACCGAPQFDESFRTLMEQTFGQKLERIPPEHEIYKLQLGYDIHKVKRRIPSQDPRASSLASEESVGEPILEGILQNGKYVVVYSKYDLSCALERQSTSACAGYAPEDAVRIAINLVLYGLLQ